MNIPQMWALAPVARPELEARLQRSDVPAERLSRKALAGDRNRAAAPRTALLSIHGIIGQWPDWWVDTSTVAVQAALQAAGADSSVERIVINIDSPGGTVAGVQELANAVYAARAKKPIYAVANSMAASAAYWAGSAATKLYAAPNAEVGSIGVYSLHVDQSAFNERVGFKATYISSSPRKIEGNPDEPLSAEARAEIQRSVDSTARDFRKAVARNRDTKYSDVLLNFGEGRVFQPADAKRLGMIDGEKTLAEVLAMPMSPKQPAGSAGVNLRRMRWNNVKRKLGN